MRILEPYRHFEDARGRMLGVINSGAWEEINYVETAAGQKRGGHYHRETHEMFLLLEGSLCVRTESPGQPPQTTTFHALSIFVVEPGEAHWFETLTACKWINILSKRIDPVSPDIVPVNA